MRLGYQQAQDSVLTKLVAPREIPQHLPDRRVQAKRERDRELFTTLAIATASVLHQLPVYLNACQDVQGAALTWEN